MNVSNIESPYSICAIDIGSPKLGNIGWSVYDAFNEQYFSGRDLDELIPILSRVSQYSAIVLGLEAVLFVPLRDQLVLATKGRKGEGSRPWSAGAGAQVLAMNLPIMTYLFDRIGKISSGVQFIIDDTLFDAHPNQILLFEALVSGKDKGSSHIDDAVIMVEYCKKFSLNGYYHKAY